MCEIYKAKPRNAVYVWISSTEKTETQQADSIKLSLIDKLDLSRVNMCNHRVDGA